MKKSLTILFTIVVLIVSFSIYKMMSQKVEYEILNIEDLPAKVQHEISTNSKKHGFSIHNDENDTYVFYRADYKEKEYISTNLSLRKKNDEYFITAVVDWASNDDLVSYEQIIKLEKVAKDDIVLMKKDKR